MNFQLFNQQCNQNGSYYPLLWQPFQILQYQPQPIPSFFYFNMINPTDYRHIGHSQSLQNFATAERSKQKAPTLQIQEKNYVTNQKLQPKKKYQRDADRNIIPNIVNKLFSFLGCKSRCWDKVKKFITSCPDLKQSCTTSKYFCYQKVLRSSLNKFVLQEDLENLFIVHENLMNSFSNEQQLCFIRINIFMLKLYYRNNFHITSVMNSYRISKEKIQDYIRYFRAIQNKIKMLSEKVRKQAQGYKSLIQ